MTDPPTDHAASAARTAAIHTGQVAALLPAVRKSMYTSALSIAVFSVLLIRFNPVGLGVWLVIRFGVSALCVSALDRLERRHELPAVTKIRLLAVLMGISGVVWGIIPAFARPEAPEWRAVVVLWLFGNQAVVTAVGSAARPVFLAAIASVTMVGAVTIGAGGGSFGIVLAALLLLGGAYSVAIFASLHRTVEAAIAARWEAGRLAHSLAERQAELERANDVLADLASHDNLTGLLNRRAFTEELTGGSETERLVGAGWIGFADIDHFKAINDTFGHRAGDEALVALARRWLPALGDEAMLARAGGDEFVLALPPCRSEEAEQVAQSLLAALDDPVRTSAGAIAVTCSIGLAEYRDDEPLAAALARADRSLYGVKARGRNGWSIAPGASNDATDEEPAGRR